MGAKAISTKMAIVPMITMAILRQTQELEPLL